MKRREFTAALLAVAALPGWAQQAARIHRLGVLFSLGGRAAADYLPVLRERLSQHGFVEGRNLTIEARFPALGMGPAAEAARELLALNADALLTCTTGVTKGAQAATSTVPIVFAWVADPVLSGIVASFARPGGNTTGVTNRFIELTNKRLELLRQLLPGARKIAMLAGYFDIVLHSYRDTAQKTAKRLGFELVWREAGGTGWSDAIRASAASGIDAALMLIPFGVFGMRQTAEEAVISAARHRFPVIYADVESVDLGGLISYATNLRADLGRAADLVAKVLRGAKPRDLPVDQAARFELAVNLSAARAIGLKIPHSILIRADRVIE
jgi:putative ABC transport system substrate-binding protein